MTPSINIEYIFARIFETLAGFSSTDSSGVPGQLIFLVTSLAVIFMVVAVVLLVLIIYVRVRLIQVEHHGFLEKEEEEHMKRHVQVAAAKNPRWELITSLASSQNESDWRRAILDADIMLQALLSDRGYVGDTLGEQLKGANPLQFTTLDLAWEAHRMRNAVAHLGEAFPLTERDVRATIEQYRRVFEEFDYI